MDTIVASASPWGRSAVAVLRLSGPEAQEIAMRLCPAGPTWKPRRASVRRATDGESIIDSVLVVWMPGPRSYTGEDVVELSCHGNPVIIEQLLDRSISLGARMARPGEFTRRAVLNGRMDLLQAEAVAAAIDAGSASGVRLALQGLEGRLKLPLEDLQRELFELTAELEARIDHPGEDLGLDSDAVLAQRIEMFEQQTKVLAESWTSGRIRVGGARVALIGKVNAGKSSLFNAILGSERALVSNRAGTTRDVIECSVVLDGLEVTFLDTAGLRDPDRSDVDELEEAGIAQGIKLSQGVDLELWVHRLDEPLNVDDLPPKVAVQRMMVGTHSDCQTVDGAVVDFAVSNLTGAGVQDLLEGIRHRLDAGSTSGEQVSLYSQRQHDLMCKLSAHAFAARDALMGVLGPAVASEELQSALQRLAELCGGDPREEVLDHLFARFCIGK